VFGKRKLTIPLRKDEIYLHLSRYDFSLFLQICNNNLLLLLFLLLLLLLKDKSLDSRLRNGSDATNKKRHKKDTKIHCLLAYHSERSGKFYRSGELAQWVERLYAMQEILCSIPACGIKKLILSLLFFIIIFYFLLS